MKSVIGSFYTLSACIDKIDKIRHKQFKDEVIFPMIDLDVQPDISWILEISNSKKYRIMQAMQQTKIKMDEKGVTVKEAVAIVARLACVSFEPETLIIDQPFLFAVKREGLKEPLFSAYLDTDGWIKH